MVLGVAYNTDIIPINYVLLWLPRHLHHCTFCVVQHTCSPTHTLFSDCYQATKSHVCNEWSLTCTSKDSPCSCTCKTLLWGFLVAYWLKHWTTDRKIQGSSPTCSRDLFLFWVHSALPQKLSRRFSFASFGGDVKPSVPGNPLKLT